MTNGEVRPIIRRKVDESITSAFEVLRKRIDKFGVTQPNIQRLGTSGRILVELPGAKDIDRVKGLLQSTAQLEFWETYKNVDVYSYMNALNERLKARVVSEEPANEVVNTESEIDSLLTDVAQDSVENNQVNPLFDLIAAPIYQGSPVIFSFAY